MPSAPIPATPYGTPDYWDQLADVLSNEFIARPSLNRGYVECPPGWNWRPFLKDYDLWFAVRGRGRLTLGTEVHDIHAGTLMFLRPGDVGWATQDPDDRLTVIYIHLAFDVPGGEKDVIVPDRWLPSRHVPVDSIAALEMQLLQVVRLLDSRRPLAETEASLILQQALLEIYRQDAANHAVPVPQLDPRLERVIGRLHSVPQERLSLQAAASMAGLSPGYFSRLFSSEVGVSFRQFALRARLDRSRYLLEETEMPVGKIAASLGYDEVFLFSRQFRQYFGVSPRRFRSTRMRTDG